MKFKTRLLITFLTIVLLPLALTAVAYISIGGYLLNAEKEFGMVISDYTMLSDPMHGFERISDRKSVV